MSRARLVPPHMLDQNRILVLRFQLFGHCLARTDMYTRSYQCTHTPHASSILFTVCARRFRSMAGRIYARACLAFTVWFQSTVTFVLRYDKMQCVPVLETLGIEGCHADNDAEHEDVAKVHV
jgi:hypothetical protein